MADKWLLWFLSEDAEPPPVTRLDFLVSWRIGGKPQAPQLICFFWFSNLPLSVERAAHQWALPVWLVLQVWTCEVGECGASLCSVECDARNCATLNWAVREDPSGRFPMALPKICRNLSRHFRFLTALCWLKHWTKWVPFQAKCIRKYIQLLYIPFCPLLLCSGQLPEEIVAGSLDFELLAWCRGKSMGTSPNSGPRSAWKGAEVYPMLL